MSKPFVAIVMGSDSDLPVMEASFEVLRSFGIAFEARITSAHRTPEVTRQFVQDAEQRGCGVFIAAAGMAAHLAGAVAAATTRPVIGVPMNASLDGLDALLSTVQMRHSGCHRGNRQGRRPQCGVSRRTDPVGGRHRPGGSTGG